MRIVSFNCRGLGGIEKGSYLRQIITKEMIDMACMQETKLAHITSQKCQTIWGDTNIDWVHNGLENGVGGMLSIWCKSRFTLSKLRIGKGFIVLEGKWGNRKQEVTIVNVYSSCELKEKNIMWEEIIKCRKYDNNKVWCVVGDFNAISILEERQGMSQSRGNKKEMR